MGHDLVRVDACTAHKLGASVYAQAEGEAQCSATARVYTLHMYTSHTTYVHCVTPIRQRAAPNEPK